MPIHAADGTLEAVFGVYLDITALMERSIKGTIAFGLTTTLALLTLYGMLGYAHRRSRRLLEAEVEERKRTERALIWATDRFDKAFYASPSMIAIVGRDDGEYYEVNGTWTKSLGYERSEVIGKTAYELEIWVDADERRHVDRALPRRWVD